MKQAKVIISGFVQGVGFRHFIKTAASKLELRGQVRNLPDGRVEAIFIGDEENIKKAIESCQKGPFLSEVKNIDVEREDLSGEMGTMEGFTVL